MFPICELGWDPSRSVPRCVMGEDLEQGTALMCTVPQEYSTVPVTPRHVCPHLTGEETEGSQSQRA